MSFSTPLISCVTSAELGGTGGPSHSCELALLHHHSPRWPSRCLSNLSFSTSHTTCCSSTVPHSIPLRATPSSIPTSIPSRALHSRCSSRSAAAWSSTRPSTRCIISQRSWAACSYVSPPRTGLRSPRVPGRLPRSQTSGASAGTSSSGTPSSRLAHTPAVRSSGSRARSLAHLASPLYCTTLVCGGSGGGRSSAAAVFSL